MMKPHLSEVGDQQLYISMYQSHKDYNLNQRSAFLKPARFYVAV